MTGKEKTLLALLPLLLAGCSSTPQYRTVVLEPPSMYLADRPLPSTDNVSTNGDLLQYCLELERSLEASNQDKAAARAWLDKARETAKE